MRTVIGGILCPFICNFTGFFRSFKGTFAPCSDSFPALLPLHYVLFLIISCPLRYRANYPDDLTLTTDTFFFPPTSAAAFGCALTLERSWRSVSPGAD